MVWQSMARALWVWMMLAAEVDSVITVRVEGEDARDGTGSYRGNDRKSKFD